MIYEQFLDSVNSGRCYAFVGSGPSCEMGYPNWRSLADGVLEAVRKATGKEVPEPYAKLLRQKRYPDLFERATRDLTHDGLLEAVRSLMRPKQQRGNIYTTLAKWPFAGYFTTNYDDEMQTHLRAEGVYCVKLLNSLADLRTVTADSYNFVCKLHGELGTDGLVLTASQYKEFRQNEKRAYFRQKLESFFQMFRLCIVGFGLCDPNIEFILTQAKQYASPSNPIFMFATDVTPEEASGLFDRYNIRIIPYENLDGLHRQLGRIVHTYDAHIVPRQNVEVRLQPQSEEDSQIASSLFIFTRLQLSGQTKEFLEDTSRALLLTALRQYPSGLEISRQAFESAAPFAKGCWQGMPDSLFEEFVKRLLESGLVSEKNGRIRLSERGSNLAEDSIEQRKLLINQFQGQAALDFQREFPEAGEREREIFSQALDSALVEGFRTRGLEIAQFITRDEPVRISDASDLFRVFKRLSAILPIS